MHLWLAYRIITLAWPDAVGLRREERVSQRAEKAVCRSIKGNGATRKASWRNQMSKWRFPRRKRMGGRGRAEGGEGT